MGDLLWNGRVALHTLNQLNQLNKWVRDFQNSKWYVSSRNVMCVNDNLVTWFSVIFIQCRDFLFEEIISKIWNLEYKMLQTKVPFNIFKETYMIKIKSSKQTLLFTTIYSFFGVAFIWIVYYLVFQFCRTVREETGQFGRGERAYESDRYAAHKAMDPTSSSTALRSD